MLVLCISVLKILVLWTGEVDIGDADVGFLLRSVSGIGSLPELLTTQLNAEIAFVPSQASPIPPLVY